MTFTFTFKSKFEIGDIITTELSNEPHTIIDLKLSYKYTFLYLLDKGNKIWVSEDFLTLIETETVKDQVDKIQNYRNEEFVYEDNIAADLEAQDLDIFGMDKV